MRHSKQYMLRQCGWLAITRQYCIKTAKPILTLFQPSGSLIILVSSDFCAEIPRGTPSAGAIYTWGWEKLAIIDGKSFILLRRLSRKWCEITAGRCFTPVIEIKPKNVYFSLKLLHRHTAYQRNVLATTMDAWKVQRAMHVTKWQY